MILILLSCFLATALAAQGPGLPYRNPALPVEARVKDLIARMTPEEKFWQLFMIPGDLDGAPQDYSKGIFGLQVTQLRVSAGEAPARADAERINTIQRYFVEHTRLGIPILPFEEAVHGLTRAGATVFPQAIALAATWDTALMGRVALAIGRETRSRGIRQVLSPVVNLASDARWGRVEETYGEDPYLSSRMARAFVFPIESLGVITTPKHFVANVGDGGRDSYPIDLSPRQLAEYHFPPFRAAIGEGKSRSVMTAYNSVDGSPATQNRWLLTTTLKGEWRFGGFVISDAAATGGATVLHHTEPSTPRAAAHAFASGLDVVFQSSYQQHRPYLEAFRRGLVPDSVRDASVARVLRAKFELGLFEQPYVEADSAEVWNHAASHRALAREAARAALVLLKNDHGVLPLASAPGRLAVIGGDAAEARLGGYTAPGATPVSILAGIRERIGSAGTVRFAPGPSRIPFAPPPVPAANLQLQGAFFPNIELSGAPKVVRADSSLDFHWTFNAPAPGLASDWYSVRWSGTLTAPEATIRTLGVEGSDGYRLYLDGKLLLDNWRKVSAGLRLADVALTPGSRHQIALEYFETTGNARVRLVWSPGTPDPALAAIDSAVSIARQSDIAVVVAGIEEGEFRDRSSLGLPGRQEELIRAVAATGTPVVVVLIGGSAISMNRWLDQVDGVLMAWYPGEEGGHAVADVLFGDVSPSGRLPVTFPVTEGQLPLVYNHKPTGRGDDYLDLSGQPQFPFGFGLSYTSFQYSGLTIEPTASPASGRFMVTCRIRNTGARAGNEVVQLYLRDELASVARPVLMLAGFARVHLEPGEMKEVSFALGPDRLGLLDEQLNWRVEPGIFQVLIGGSSRDIRLRGDLEVR